MRRRDILAALGAVIAWPLSVRAQQLPVVGFLHSGSAKPNAHLVAAFLRGLDEAGFKEGRNVVIEYRWAEGKYDLLPRLANDLAGRQVTVLYTAGGSISAFEAHKASNTIPLVYVMGSDPVKVGLAASFNHPGGNATGVTLITNGLEAKRIELLHQLVPSATLMAALVNPDNLNAPDVIAELQSAGKALGVTIHLLQAANDAQLDASFASLPQLKAGGFLIGNDPFFLSRRDRINAELAKIALPAISQSREFPAAGGLASYGSNLADMYRKSGVYVGRILKGEKASDLPVQQPTNFELIFNLKTAKALGLTIPQSLLATADEVIE
jgi:putative ABC transport system substrate-binding protein